MKCSSYQMSEWARSCSTCKGGRRSSPPNAGDSEQAGSISVPTHEVESMSYPVSPVHRDRIGQDKTRSQTWRHGTGGSGFESNFGRIGNDAELASVGHLITLQQTLNPKELYQG